MKTFDLKQERFENGTITPTWDWFDGLSTVQQEKISEIENIIRENRFVSERVLLINAKFGAGTCFEMAMGSGGVGQVKVLEEGTIRIQIGYGKGKWNYAMVAEI